MIVLEGGSHGGDGQLGDDCTFCHIRGDHIKRIQSRHRLGIPYNSQRKWAARPSEFNEWRQRGDPPLIKNAIPSLSAFGQCPLNTLISGRLSLSHDAPVAAAGPPARLPLLTHTSINYLPRLPSGIKDLSVPPHAPDTW